MQAHTKIQNDIVVVALSGRVDVETAEPFRAACLRELRGKRVVFDFSKLSFVGSQGLLPFLETLQSFYELTPGSFKFSGVGLDFRKLLAATPLNVVEMHESVDHAIHAFYMPVTIVPVPSVAAPLDSYLSYRPEPLGGVSQAATVLDEDADV